MSEQPAPGWYPDGQGNERYWDGLAWTEQIRPPAQADGARKGGAFSKLGAVVKSAAAEKKASKEELARRQAEYAEAAGRLVTSGVFGTSTVEIYENGYVRIASWGEGLSAATPKAVDKKTPYEKLHSIKFTQPEDETSTGSSGLEEAVGPAVAKLLKGGRGLIKASAPGMAAAGIAHIASNAARKSFLTVVTDRQIHTLANQTTNSVGLKTSNKGHNDVGRALEVAGNAVLGVGGVEPQSVVTALTVAAEPTLTAAPKPMAPTLSDRLRELADLHKDGILSQEEFAAAKAKLLADL